MLTGMYARLIGIGLIVAAVLGAFWYVNHLQNEVVQLNQTVALKDASIKQLTTAIDTQNAAVDQLKKDADERLKTAQAAIDQAKAEAAKAKARADSAYRAKPSDPNDLCKSALELVNGGTK